MQQPSTGLEEKETCDLSQTDSWLRDGMEETGRGCSDVWGCYHLGVRDPQRGQCGASPAGAGQCLSLPTFCNPLASLLLPSCKCQAGQTICRGKAISPEIRACCVCL